MRIHPIRKAFHSISIVCLSCAHGFTLNSFLLPRSGTNPTGMFDAGAGFTITTTTTIVTRRIESNPSVHKLKGLWRCCSKTSSPLHSNFQSSNEPNNAFDVEAAKVKLVWEIMEEKESRPILNLSARESSPEQEDEEEVDNKNSDTSSWESGQLWTSTRKGLEELGILPKDDDDAAAEKLLRSIPQLIRLDTTSILQSAKIVMEECGDNNIQPIIIKEPRILTFPPDDVRYGFEFLSTMMALPPPMVATVCVASPELLLGAIEGGLQERAVSRALGAAADSTDTANKRIAGNLAASWKTLKGKKLL